MVRLDVELEKARNRNKIKSAKINQPTDYGEMRSKNQYVVAPGSYVPLSEKDINKLSEEAKIDEQLGYYTIRKSVPPRPLSYEDLPEFFRKEKEIDDVSDSEVLQREEKKSYVDKGGKYSDLLKLKMSDIVDDAGSDKRTGHPLHESTTDANFSLSKDGNLCHCWRHDNCLNAVQYLAVKAGYSNCKDAGTPHGSKELNYTGRKFSKLKGDKKALDVAYKEAVKMGLIEEYAGKAKNILLNKISQAEIYRDENPFFYDRNKIWMNWDKKNYRWEKCDEVDILGNIYDDNSADIVASKERTEITNSIKHVGRRNIPEELPGDWMQYKNKLYNIENDEVKEATADYFITNPIPYVMGESEDTPEIDKLFVSWVGEEHKQELYEILAFAQAPKYFIHRIICLIGSGANGKSTFLTLMRKYLDDNNVVTSSLENLMKVRFEGSKLYRKTVCFMGETNFGTLKSTEYIKGLSGEDKLRIEFKGKDGFDAVNYAKLILATNSLPATADKTDGFYRRWKIINFDNKFTEEKDVLSGIPEIEYNNLARKCFRILKELWEKRIFTNDGGFEDRKANYEKHSNPLALFLSEKFKKDVNADYLSEDFREEFIGFLSDHGFRELSPKAISQQLVNNHGFSIKQLNKAEKNGRYILGLTRKITDVTDVTGNSTHSLQEEQVKLSVTSDTSVTSFKNNSSSFPICNKEKCICEVGK